MDKNQVLLNQMHKYFSRAATNQNRDVVISSGKGSYVYDANGKQYIDLLSSATTANVGHCNPHVVHAIQKQAAKLLDYTPVYFANTTEVNLMPKLLKMIPMHGPLELSWGTSGSESDDSIIKFARGYTRRPYVISYDGSCHGSDYGGASATGEVDQVRNIGPLLPGIIKVPYPAPWLKLKGETEDQFVDRLFNEFLMPFENYVPADETAVIMVEPIQGDGGIIKAPEKYLQKVYHFAHQHGILFAVDEINQGLGRSGTWWSIQHFHNIEPDILVTGKALASGLPLSATIGKKAIMESLVFPEDAFTTARNPVVAAACSATLDVIQQEHLVTRSKKMGPFAKKFFDEEASKYPFIGDVRMYGLNGGIDVVKPGTKKFDPKLAEKICDLLVKNGVIMTTTNFSVLRFQPPLVIKKSTLSKAFIIIDHVFKEINQHYI